MSLTFTPPLLLAAIRTLLEGEVAHCVGQSAKDYFKNGFWRIALLVYRYNVEIGRTVFPPQPMADDTTETTGRDGVDGENSNEGTFASETTTVTGHITSSGLASNEKDGIDTTIEVSVIASRCEFYDDGRATLSVTGTVAGETTVKMRKKTVLGTSKPVFEAFIRDTDSLPDDVRAERDSSKVSISDDEAYTVASLYDDVEEKLDARRENLQDENEMTVSVERKWEDGRGETHANHATGTVSFADDRELGIHWRNTVDIGHQTFLDDDDENGNEFAATEIDAAISLARDESPITRAMRM